MATDHNGMHVLDVDECLRLLTSHRPRVGRIAVVTGREPVILPVNYVFHEGAVIFRTDPGTKLGAALTNEMAAFEIDEVDPAWEEGWSVVVTGRLEEVSNAAEVERLRGLPLRPWAGAKAAFVRLHSARITGRSLA